MAPPARSRASSSFLGSEGGKQTAPRGYRRLRPVEPVQVLVEGLHRARLLRAAQADHQAAGRADLLLCVKGGDLIGGIDIQRGEWAPTPKRRG